MRLFLDAHVSARRIAAALRAQHDVRAADKERELDGCDDNRLLALATEEARMMVTFNVADFARIATEWAAASRSHAGCLLIVGIDHREFGLTLRVINLSLNPSQPSRLDRYTARGPGRHSRPRTRRPQPHAEPMGLGGWQEGVAHRSRPPKKGSTSIDSQSREAAHRCIVDRGREMDAPRPPRSFTPETNQWL